MSLTIRTTRSFTVSAILCLLFACGGGGGSAPPPPPPPPSTYTVTATVSGLSGSGLTLLNNGGDARTVTGNGPVTFPTAILSGANYAITVSASPVNPIQKCTVTNGSGTVGSANVTNPSVVCTTQAARNGFSLNYYGGTVSTYTVDSLSGQLRLRGLMKAGDSPITFYGDKAGKFLFVLNGGAAQSTPGIPPIPQTHSSLSAFAFTGSADDANEVSGSPYATSSGQAAATGLSALPGDGFLYVTNSSLNNIDAFAVGATGTLTAVPGSPFATGPSPNPVTFDSAGHFGYVANQTASSIFVYSVNSSTGALTEMQANRVATGPAPGAVFVTADGKFAYVLNTVSASQASISAFTVAGGALTAIAGSPFPVTGGGGSGNAPMQLAPSSNGKVLYVKNDGGAGTGWLAALSIDSGTGVLAPLAGSPYALGVSATAIEAELDPAGRFLYVANQGPCTVANGCTPGPGSIGSISAFSIDATGALTALAGLPSVSPPPYAVSVDPSGDFLYQANVDSNQIISYSINQTSGALTMLQSGGTSRTGGEPVFVGTFLAPAISTPNVFQPKFAYVPNVTGNTVSAYLSDPVTGKLTAVGTAVPAGVAPQAVAVSLRGNVAFVASAGSSPTTSPGTITAYTIDAASGALTAVPGPLPTGKGPSAIAADRTGRYVYVANAYDGTISGYSADVASGALTALGTPTSTLVSNPIGVVVDPTGQNLYVLGPLEVDVFEIDTASGAIALSSVGYPVFGASSYTLPAAGATQFTVDPNGNFAYVPIFNSKMVAIYPINSYSGTLNGEFGSAPQQVTTGRANTSISIDPTGRFAYTADYTDNTVSAYSIDPIAGGLTAIGSPIQVGANALSISADFSGKFVYAVLANNTVAAFSIGNTGALTPIAGGGAPTGNGPGPITTVGAVQ